MHSSVIVGILQLAVRAVLRIEFRVGASGSHLLVLVAVGLIVWGLSKTDVRAIDRQVLLRPGGTLHVCTTWVMAKVVRPVAPHELTNECHDCADLLEFGQSVSPYSRPHGAESELRSTRYDDRHCC